MTNTKPWGGVSGPPPGERVDRVHYSVRMSMGQEQKGLWLWRGGTSFAEL